MAAKLFGTSGLTWGLSAETGILVQSYERAVTGSENQALNHEGETAGVSFYNSIAEHTVSGYYTGSSGIPAASIGVALTIANVMTGNGVAAGLVLTSGVTDTEANEDYRTISVTAKQFPLITA